MSRSCLPKRYIMTLGEKIKKIRVFRGMTQREFGIRLGYKEHSADVRIAQYEAGNRIPKKDTLLVMAEILEVNPINFTCTEEENEMEFIQMVLWMEEKLHIYPVRGSEYRAGICVENPQIKEFLEKWMYQKELLKEGEITEQEYLEWKLGVV